MIIVVNRSGYNGRRYSKPWIAIVTGWDVGQERPEIKFGAYIGNDRGGVLEIEAEPGDIIRMGQRDLRNSKYTESDWYIVSGDADTLGSLMKTTPAEARKTVREKQQKGA
jgi:hypothetical protein